MTEGILAIWNDCRAEHEAAYEAWYAEEHLPERLSIPGFRRGRRYETVDGAPAFFTYYETGTPGVLSSPAYLERVENPTTRTRRIMTESFLNMSRTACQVVRRHGRARGAWAATLRFPEPPPNVVLDSLHKDPGVARTELWMAAEPARDSAEARLRGGDDSIGACIFVETLREAPAIEILEELRTTYGGTGALHRLLCELTAPGPG